MTPRASQTTPDAPVLRIATLADVAELDALIAAAGIALSRGFYSDAQARAITAEVFGVDTQLIVDGTYFAIEDRGALVAAGGWSRRGTLYGSDHAKHASTAAHGGAVAGVPDPLLAPAVDAARIRAFFVSPAHARRGLGARLMRHSAAQAWSAGFRRLTLVATLPGEPLYAAFGFTVDDRFEVSCDGLKIPLVNMSRPLLEANLDRR